MKVALKWIVGLGLMAVLVYAVDWHQIGAQFSRVTFGAIAIVMALLTVQFPLSVWKWSWALRMHGLDHGWWFLFRVLLIGFFFNNFLPTSIGGDLYRIYRTTPSDGFRSRSLSAVAIERVVGLCSLLSLGAIGAVQLAENNSVAQAYLLVFLSSAGLGVFGLIALYKGWLKRFTVYLRPFRIFSAIEHNLGHIFRIRREWVPLIGLSFLFQSIAIVIVFVLYWGLGVEVSLAACALIASSAAIAAFLPVSINGLGIVEVSYTGAALALGVDYQTSIVVPILIRVLTLPHSLASALVYLSDRSDTGHHGRPQPTG